jgi:hypothetical protein
MLRNAGKLLISLDKALIILKKQFTDVTKLGVKSILAPSAVLQVKVLSILLNSFVPLLGAKLIVAPKIVLEVLSSVV